MVNTLPSFHGTSKVKDSTSKPPAATLKIIFWWKANKFAFHHKLALHKKQEYTFHNAVEVKSRLMTP